MSYRLEEVLEQMVNCILLYILMKRSSLNRTAKFFYINIINLQFSIVYIHVINSLTVSKNRLSTFQDN